MPTPIDMFKKVYVELDISGSPQQYNLINDTFYTNSCFLNFSLISNSQTQVVDLTVIQKTSVSGTIENTQTFTLNNNNNFLKRNINLFTPYTLIDISYNSLNSILSGFIEKMTLGDTIVVDSSEQTIAVRGGVDISGQRVDISGQRLIVSVSNTVPVSGSVSITGEVNITEDNRVLLGTNNIAGGTSTLTSINPPNTDAGVRALHTLNYNNAYNNDVGIYLPMTTKSIGNTYALNCFNIPAETKHYTFGGIDDYANAYRIIGGNPSSSGLPLDLYDYGFPNARTYVASLSGGAPSCLLYIDYVNSSGDLVENAGAYTVVNTTTTLNWTTLPSMIGPPIKFRTSANIGNTVNTGYVLYISPVTNTNRAICHSSIANYGIGVFTIPNGYIGYISAITAGYSTAGSLIMVKWDVNGIRQVVYKINIGSTLNIVVSAGYEGMLGGIFVAGESIAFTNNLATTNKLVQASITLRPI